MMKLLHEVHFTQMSYHSNRMMSLPFKKELRSTISHIFFACSFAISFWNEICEKIFNKLSTCSGLLLEYREIILGFLTGEMDLLNYKLILGKAYLWTCRCKEMKPSFRHFERILLNNIKLKSIFLLNRITSVCLRKNGEFLRKCFF